MRDVYRRLRERLDDLASGFPTAESGIEMKILKRLFTEEEAELFLNLTPVFESSGEVAKRTNGDPQKTADFMEEMAKKGLLFRLKKADTALYKIVPFIPGIYDFQLGTMGRRLAQDVQDYFEESIGRTIQGHNTPIMRPIPINRKLVVEWPIAPYEDALKIIEAQEIIALAPCVCRTKNRLLNESCDKPLETCFMFGSNAKYYVENKMARYITKDEARKVILKNDEIGLVMQPFNSQNAGVMCSCCGDCCQMLGSLKKQKIPAKAVRSNYFSTVDVHKCVACETCLGRCQMEAIAIKGKAAVIDPDRCIGCGLCASACIHEAAQLVKKAESEQYIPPKTNDEIFMALALERKKDLPVLTRPKSEILSSSLEGDSGQCYCEKFAYHGMKVSDKCFRDLWLFDDLNEEENSRCREIGSIRIFDKGQAVFFQGDRADEMFLVKAGRIKLSKVLESGTEIILDFRKEGDMIGENMISEEIVYPVTAWSMEETITCGFNRTRFENLIKEFPGIGLKIIQTMGKRISNLTHRLGSMSAGSLEDRLYNVLSNIAFEHGKKGPNGYILEFPITHEEIGFLIGAHRVTITKAMKELVHSGKVIRSSKGLTLPSQPI